MIQLTMKFGDAADYLANNTYFSVADAETMLKYSYHLQGFMKQMKRRPNEEEISKILEHCRTDKALAWYKMTWERRQLDHMVKQTNKVNPFGQQPVLPE